jgi:hypothetical protein
MNSLPSAEEFWALMFFAFAVAVFGGIIDWYRYYRKDPVSCPKHRKTDC